MKANQPPFLGNDISDAVHGSSTHVILDPNHWVLWAVDATKSLKTLVGEPLDVSELSGKPAYLVDIPDRHNGRPLRQLRLKLTEDEWRRMNLRSLTPKEWRKLTDAHGIFFAVHEDFYNNRGRALQPHEPVLENEAPKVLTWISQHYGGGFQLDLSPGIKIEVSYSTKSNDPEPWRWHFCGLNSKKAYKTVGEAQAAALAYAKANLQKALAKLD